MNKNGNSLDTTIESILITNNFFGPNILTEIHFW